MENITIITIYKRIRSETPKFWKKVRYLMITCGAIGGSLIALPKEYTAWLPENIPGILITIGTVGTALASLTVNDQKKQEHDQA
jgi:hypothetical protein